MSRAPFKSCGHEDCDFGGREEYCAGAPVDTHNPHVQATLYHLDELIYEVGPSTQSFQMRLDQEESEAEYALLQWHADDQDKDLPPVEKWLTVTHTHNKLLKRDTYAIAMGWTILHTVRGTYTATYGIDVSQFGNVRGIMTTPITDMLEQGIMAREDQAEPVEHNMTAYDYQQLARELQALRAVQLSLTDKGGGMYGAQ